MRSARRALLLAGLAVIATSAEARPQQDDAVDAVQTQDVARLIEEASRRFGVPVHWIRAVMRQESAFDPNALSHAGAMGLMQVMPATYAELRARYGLGQDPWNPRDNILAGVAYLRELHDRFGSEGMLAAYNAGPGRYLEHRDHGRPLPAATRDYVARIGPRLGLATMQSAPEIRPSPASDPARSALFPSAMGRPSTEGDSLFVGLGSDPEDTGHSPL